MRLTTQSELLWMGCHFEGDQAQVVGRLGLWLPWTLQGAGSGSS